MIEFWWAKWSGEGIASQAEEAVWAKIRRRESQEYVQGIPHGIGWLGKGGQMERCGESDSMNVEKNIYGTHNCEYVVVSQWMCNCSFCGRLPFLEAAKWSPSPAGRYKGLLFCSQDMSALTPRYWQAKSVPPRFTAGDTAALTTCNAMAQNRSLIINVLKVSPLGHTCLGKGKTTWTMTFFLF